MSVQWLQPGAWWGLAAVAVPILIHLLVRQESRRLLFPSLRFLRATPVASWRRRFISDWLLLGLRLLILATAVAALAAPTFLTDARRAAWRDRVARAIVVVPLPADSSGASPALSAGMDERVRHESESSAFVATFQARRSAGDAIRDAVLWLQTQPPATREVVIVGDLRRGAMTAGDIAMIPPDVGVRFAVVGSPPRAAVVSMTATADNGDGGTQVYDLQIGAGDRATDVTYRSVPHAADWLNVEAAPSEQRFGDAVREATLAEGLVNDRPADRRVTVVFTGAPTATAAVLTRPAAGSWMRHVLERLPTYAGGERQGRLVVLAGVSAADPAAVDVVARIARTALGSSRAALEPVAIDPGRLAQWTRLPGPANVAVPPRDEGDRRWLWAGVLALLSLEQVLRRARSPRREAAAPLDDREARVA